MRPKFQRVILYARQHRANQNVNETLTRLSDFFTQSQVEVCVDMDTASYFSTALPILSRKEMGLKQDLIVVVGGDGSLLSAARMAVEVDVPVIGINRGRLGFLTDIAPDNFEKQLSEVIAGNYIEEHRFLLKTTIHDKDSLYFQGKALNDVVLSRGTATHLVEFDVYVEKELISHFRSDGMILSTPTGSTAYALSAGGPIMHPQLNAIVIVPMFSHSLSSRPLVVDGNSLINIVISEKNEAGLYLSCDGHESMIVKPGQEVSIEKNAQRLRLLHPDNYQYYETLRAKLGWETRHQG